MRKKLPPLPEGFSDPGLPKGVLSHSQYSLFKNCGEAYYRQYVLGLRSPMSPAAYKGVVVHGGIEETLLRVIDTGSAPSLEEMRQKIVDLFAEQQDEVPVWEEDEPSGKAKDTAVALYSAWHVKALPKIHPIAVEEGFAKKIGTVPVIGFIDLVDHVHGTAIEGDPGYFVVADTKTGKAAWSQDDIDKDPQFTLYSLVKAIPRVRVDSLTMLKAGPDYKSKESTRGLIAHQALVQDYEQVADFIKRGIFPKTALDSWMCGKKWCSHWTSCRGAG